MPHTTRKNVREWQRLWRAGEIITEIDGDDPGMPRHAPRERKARAWPLGLRGRKSTAAHKEPSRCSSPASFSVRPTGATVTAAPFFVPGRAEKPQEPRPPPRTQPPQAEPARPYVSQTAVCDTC